MAARMNIRCLDLVSCLKMYWVTINEQLLRKLSNSNWRDIRPHTDHILDQVPANIHTSLPGPSASSALLNTIKYSLCLVTFIVSIQSFFACTQDELQLLDTAKKTVSTVVFKKSAPAVLSLATHHQR
jgi:hypothetical protein